MENEQSNVSNDRVITQMALFHLKSTVVWMKIFAIFLLIGAGWVGFVGLQALSRGGQEAMPVLLIGLGLYGTLGYLLLTASNKFNTYIESSEASDLEEAFSKQKSYWIIMGILGILGMLGILIFFIYYLQYGGRF